VKLVPTDPFAFQARIMSALCDDLFDIGARRSTKFARLDSLHGTVKALREKRGD